MYNCNKFASLAFLLLSFQISFPQNYNYAEVLQKSLFFYECQRSGALPLNNRVNWRGNSGMNDGADKNTDLTGGWYDAGDHVKFGFPMAHSATRLAWSGIENKAAYQSSGLWSQLLENIKWVNDYFLRCHKRNGDGSTARFYGQVGKGADDHGWWGPAEVMRMVRPSYYVDPSLPGSELTAETAAAMAAASMVFASDDPTYSSLLLDNAKALYSFAETYQGKYTASITDAKNFYESYSGYTDELAWGALWIYKASGNSTYLTKARSYYNRLPNETRESVKAYSWGDNWDNKAFATYILMAMTTGETTFKNDAERYLDFWTQGYNGKKVTYSPGGQAFLDQWGSLRYSANTAFLALLYGKYIQNSNTSRASVYTNFGLGQINYMLGSNPSNRSYVIGFGNNPPRNPHHRTSHSSWTGSLNEPLNNRHILFGALVGGPARANDAYTDSRSDYQANEVACDYNAGFTCAIAFLVEKYGGTALPNFPQPETFPSCSEYICIGSSKGTSFKLRLQNRTGWPARKETNACYRYYFGLDGNLKVSDYKATLSYTSKPGATVAIYPYNSTTGYIEVCMPGIEIIPGGATICYVETQIAFGLRTGLSSTLFNFKNDWSYYKTDNVALSTTSETQRVAIFSNGNKVCGILPPSLINNSLTWEGESAELPIEASGLTANVYPNPSSGTTKMEIRCRDEGQYTIDVYNRIGQRISTQRIGKLLHGTHHINITLPDSQKGIFLIHLKEQSGREKWIGKMIQVN